MNEFPIPLKDKQKIHEIFKIKNTSSIESEDEIIQVNYSS